MFKNKSLLVTVSILILAFAASAGAQPGPIGQNILAMAKPGQEAQYEVAYKEHLEWHSDMDDTWGWRTKLPKQRVFAMGAAATAPVASSLSSSTERDASTLRTN